MVKKSKKSKSKRVSLKKKYKIIKKVKEHHRKKAKEAKKLGFKRKKVEKDPGIPNDWPFKEQELRALEARRARALEELEQKKALRKERAQKRKLGLLEGDEQNDIASDKQSKPVNDGIGMSKIHERAFYKELVKVIEVSDVILEVLDARDPLGTRCIEMEKMVQKYGPEKHLVLLLNKIDLVPREAAEKWLKYLREELPAVAFKCNTQEQRSNLGWKSASKAARSSNLLQTSDCLGAETLIKLLKNYSRSHELKKSITVGVVGLPNVGKSSLINSLKRSHVVNVGATPGLTRTMQEVQLDKNVKLLDCPGVVMLKPGENGVSIALRNCKRIEKLDDPISPVREILKLCPAEKLMAVYKLPRFSSVDEFLQKVASLRGKLKKGGVLDMEAAAKIVLRDWNEGKIPYYTFPPVRNQGEKLESAIVSELGKEFNVDEIYGEESSFIGSLVSVADASHVEVPPSSPVNLDEQMLESEDDEESDEAMEDTRIAEAADSAAGETTRSNSGQNDKLYSAEGILDPRKTKAEKKRRKKAEKSVPMDGDYDFMVDYKIGKPARFDALSEQDGADGADGADEDQAGNQVPMSGVEVDA
ncbi:guanine nucleotide-binding protein-like NSN1 isoform X2 [Nymphaea colorata]|uniref:guanine nucleotide-binding protein-like NSN1 isoform X2 n=1 Tax=Nymphaea colorata TaxID=210225 RepID=UPI00129EED4A|nr:guanine nucleotide-binding protein-like NSN1 isoform X2 [Nymphaea colorata]